MNRPNQERDRADRGGGLRRPLLLAGLGATLLLATLSVALGYVRDMSLTLDPGFGLIMYSLLTFYWVLGAIIVLRADGHVVGWLFAIGAPMMGSVFGCWAASAAVMANDPTSPLAGWFTLVGALLFIPAIILVFPAVIIVFPTGTLPGPRFRWPVRLVAAMVVAQMLAIPLLVEPSDPLQPANPLAASLTALPPVVVEFLHGLMSFGSLALPLATGIGVAAVAVRFRGSHGEQRAQLKWLLAATVPAAVLIPLSVSGLAPSVPFLDAASVATLWLVALSVALAILRYRLYDIDRVISRTIAYGLLTALLVAVFLLVNLGLQWMLSSVTTNNALAVAGSTLFVAALFTPVRQRVQRIVDRRFDRARYDGERTASAFSTRMRDAIDLPAVAADLDGTVREAMAPTGLGLWLRGSGR